MIWNSVESIEANPQTELMGMGDEFAKAHVVVFGPRPGFPLTSAFYHTPGIIPPAPIIIARLRNQNLSGRHRILPSSMTSAKHEQFISNRNHVVKVSFLAVSLAG